jgi:myo-inositol 2-dehydrogenase/D-chiro-inositol 1-dehydrogenase
VIRIGLIGCGFIGSVHSFALHQLARVGLIDARVTATFDPDVGRAAAIAAHHGAEVSRDLPALLDAVDVAWVCTWTAAHREAVDAAVSAGRAIFCEKPLAPTLVEAEQISAALGVFPTRWVSFCGMPPSSEPSATR